MVGRGPAPWRCQPRTTRDNRGYRAPCNYYSCFQGELGRRRRSDHGISLIIATALFEAGRIAAGLAEGGDRRVVDAAGANRPPDRVLPRLRSGDLALNPRKQLFRFHVGQS
jgi:hypothetical protein